MQKYKVGVLQINPHTLWRQGGGEIHANKYIEYGNDEHFHIEKFNFNSPWSYDIIHFFGANYQMNDIGMYARKEGIKVVGTPILFPTVNVGKYRVFLKLGNILPFPTTLNLRQQLLLNSDLLIANSQPEATYLSGAYGVPPAKISILGTGVDSEFLDYQFSENDLPENIKGLKGYALMVGRVTPLKNQLAVASIFEKANIPLVLVGQPDASRPDYIAALKNIIKRASNIHWIEGVEANSRALKSLYAKAICHVLWSDTEVAALVNMEAASLGCPVVSRNHVTTKDIMKDKALYASTEDELVKQVRTVAAWSDEKRMQSGIELKKFIKEKYTWQNLVADNLKIYMHLIK